MEAMALNPVAQIQPFGLLIVLYLFLAGLSAGCFLLSSLWTVFGWEKVRPLSGPAAMLAFITFIPAPLVLIADLAYPTRFLTMMFHFNPVSVMSWGTWILALYGPIAMYSAWRFWNNQTINQGVALAGMGLVLGLGLYTGLLLGVIKAHPLWNSAILPVLFLVSGIICAAALLTFLVMLLPTSKYDHLKSAVQALKDMKPFLATFEALLLGFHLVVLALATVGARESVLNLLTGSRHIQFVWMQLGAGLLLPALLLAFWARGNTLIIAIAGLLSVMGVYALRYNFIFGGQETPIVIGSVPVFDITGWQIALTVIVLASVTVASYIGMSRIIAKSNVVANIGKNVSC